MPTCQIPPMPLALLLHISDVTCHNITAPSISFFASCKVIQGLELYTASHSHTRFTYFVASSELQTHRIWVYLADRNWYTSGRYLLRLSATMLQVHWGLQTLYNKTFFFFSLSRLFNHHPSSSCWMLLCLSTKPPTPFPISRSWTLFPFQVVIQMTS